MRKFLLVLILAVTSSLSMAAQTHHTDLSWTAAVPQAATSTTPAQTFTKYNVYRSATSGVYTKGTPFASVPFGTNAFSDTTPTAGQVWFYVATTVCSNCSTTESSFSNEVKATTPLDTPGQPAPPTNLNGTPQ